MQEYVQISISTTFFPLNCPIVIGWPPVLIYPSGETSSGALGYMADLCARIIASVALSATDTALEVASAVELASPEQTPFAQESDGGGSLAFNNFCSMPVRSNPLFNRYASNRVSAPVNTARPTMRNKIPIERRNHPSGSIATPSRSTSFCPTSAMMRRNPLRPSAYAPRSRRPIAKLAGNTVARITKYVGEQLENTGPSAAPMITSPKKEFF